MSLLAIPCCLFLFARETIFDDLCLVFGSGTNRCRVEYDSRQQPSGVSCARPERSRDGHRTPRRADAI